MRRSDQVEYDELGRGLGPVGVAVEFRYPDEGAVRTPGSGY